jgi:Helix-turn-helix domain
MHSCAAAGDFDRVGRTLLSVALDFDFRRVCADGIDAEQFKAILAAEIIKTLDRGHLTVRAAHARTGTAADFSRIRNANLGRFTVDRLISIINRLGSRVEVRIRLHRTASVAHEARRRGVEFDIQKIWWHSRHWN